jgi:hypothetical protein
MSCGGSSICSSECRSVSKWETPAQARTAVFVGIHVHVKRMPIIRAEEPVEDSP